MMLEVVSSGKGEKDWLQDVVWEVDHLAQDDSRVDCDSEKSVWSYWGKRKKLFGFVCRSGTNPRVIGEAVSIK
jgi:hypothetical protein